MGIFQSLVYCINAGEIEYFLKYYHYSSTDGTFIGKKTNISTTHMLFVEQIAQTMCLHAYYRIDPSKIL